MQTESDPFTFDDNRTPSKISMPDTGTGGIQQKKFHEYDVPKPPFSRSNSNYSTSGETTLKGLLISSNTSFQGSSGHQNPSKGKPSGHKLEKSNSLQKVTTGSDGRKYSSDSTGSIGGQPSSHKQLVRQNANAKAVLQKTPSFQGKMSDGSKAKKKGGTVGKDGHSVTTGKRRGRPPSTDKKDANAKERKLEAQPSSSDDSEQARGNIVLNIQLNKGQPLSSTTKTKPALQEGGLGGTTTTVGGQMGNPMSAGNPSGNPSMSNNSTSISNDQQQQQTKPKSSSPFTDLPPDLQRYFKSQEDFQQEAIKKKKEKKMIPSHHSVMSSQQQGKGAIKSSSTSSISSMSAKSTSNSASSIAGGNMTNQATSSQKMAARGGRKNSLKDVVDKLSFRQQSTEISSAPNKVVTGNNPPLQRNNSSNAGLQGGIGKSSMDKVGSSNEMHAFKPMKQNSKPSTIQKGGSATQHPSMKSISKSQSSSSGQMRPNISKPPALNRSPSHSMKQMSGNRPSYGNMKGVKPRSVTPTQRELIKGSKSPSLTKSPPKVMDPKLKQTLNKIHETAAASASKPIGNLPGDIAKQRMGMNRPGSGGRLQTSPRDITPGASGRPPTNYMNTKEGPLHSLLKGKSSSPNEQMMSGVVVSRTPPPRVPTPTIARKNTTPTPPYQDFLTPPVTKKPAFAADPTQANLSVTTGPSDRPAVSMPHLMPSSSTNNTPSNNMNVSPMSPGDGLVIDDPSVVKPSYNTDNSSTMPASDITSVVQQTPTTTKPQQQSNLFMMSPSTGMVQSPQITADDLFDEAVS